MPHAQVPELLPCPFCGPGGFRIGVGCASAKGSASGKWYTARCPICRTYGPRAHSVDEATKKWNQRAEVTELHKEISALKAENYRLRDNTFLADIGVRKS